MSLPPKSSRHILAPKTQRQRLDLRTTAELQEAPSAATSTVYSRSSAAKSSSLEAVLVGVPVGQLDSAIADQVRLTFKSATTVRRIQSYPRQVPTSYVSVRFTDPKDAAAIIKDGVTLAEALYTAEPPRKRPRRANPTSRCFNCQQITTTHVSRTCPNTRRCPRCACDHAEADCQADVARCANCNQEHYAFSNQCPAWTRQQQRSARETTPACSQDVHDLRSDCKRIHQVAEANNRYLKTQHELFLELVAILNTQAAELVELRRLVVISTPPTEILRDEDDSLQHASFNTTTDLVGDVVLDSSEDEEILPSLIPEEEEDGPLPPLSEEQIEEVVEGLFEDLLENLFTSPPNIPGEMDNVELITEPFEPHDDDPTNPIFAPTYFTATGFLTVPASQARTEWSAQLHEWNVKRWRHEMPLLPY